MSDQKYKVIRKKILNLIVNQGMSVGSKLPPERKLAELFATSAITVRRALKELQEKEIIESRHGSGNFVKSELTALHNCGNVIYLGIDSFPPNPNNVSLMRQHLAERGYNLQIVTAGPTPEKNILEKISEANGIIACGWISREWVEYLRALDIPTLSIGSNPYHGIISRVTFNWRRATSKLVTYFIENGAKKIGLLAGAKSYVPSDEMRTGYREAIKKHGLTYNPDMVIFPKGGKRFEEISQYLKTFTDLDALIVEAGSFEQLMCYYWQHSGPRPMLGLLTESGILEEPVNNIVEVRFHDNIYVKGIEALFDLIESPNGKIISVQSQPSLIY